MVSFAVDIAGRGEWRQVCASDGLERVGYCVQCGELEAEVAKLKAARKEQKQMLAERDSTAVQVRWPQRVRPLGHVPGATLSPAGSQRASSSRSPKHCSAN